MTGDEWLEQVFRPTLRPDVLGRSDAVDNLRGQVRALHDCGVLDDAAHTAAEAELDAALAEAGRRWHEQFTPVDPEPPVAQATVTFDRVLAVGRPIAAFEGVPVLLTSIEMWSHRVDLAFVAVPAVASEERLRDYEEQLTAWHRRRSERRSGEAALHPPNMPSHQLIKLEVRLRDDLGTRYRVRAASSGGSATEWQSQRYYRPGVPAGATRLTVEALSAGRRVIGRIEVPL